jgi:hypothetical protein
MGFSHVRPHKLGQLVGWVLFQDLLWTNFGLCCQIMIEVFPERR